jgi:uncharacterized protein with FMN-binding domain
MLNASPSNPRPPGKVPRRGMAMLVLMFTVTALLFSFKTPEDMFGPVADAGVIGSMSIGEPVTAQRVDLQPGAGTAVASTVDAATATATPPATDTPTLPPATDTPTLPPATEPPVKRVLTGQLVRTPYGPVQVEVTLDANTISDVTALQLPFDRSYSARISRVVAPMLREETLQAQSAQINLISGATYTSKGYAMSLQSALDQAA